MNSPALASARPGTIGRLVHLYRVNIVDEGRGGRFLMTASFLVTFAIVRGITHAIRDQKFTFLFRNVSAGGGKHLHHLVFGIVGLLFVGYMAIGFRPSRPWARRTLAVIYGVAAALTLDEFALWLRLEDVYWAKQGRESVDAVVLTASVFLLGAEGHPLWRAMARDAHWLLRRNRGDIPIAKSARGSKPSATK